MSCQRAQGFLEKHDWQVREMQDAGKKRRAREEALTLARAADKLVIAKGKKVVAFDMKKDPPDENALLQHLLGPTGNLRAPTLRKGRTLLVGFSQEAYKQFLG